MKLSEIRPCDNCSGPLSQGHFYVVRVSQALVLPKPFHQVMGLTQYFGFQPGALALAEVMAPDADVIKVFGDEKPELMQEFLLCMECYLRPLDLAVLMEKRTRHESA